MSVAEVDRVRRKWCEIKIIGEEIEFSQTEKEGRMLLDGGKGESKFQVEILLVYPGRRRGSSE